MQLLPAPGQMGRVVWSAEGGEVTTYHKMSAHTHFYTRHLPYLIREQLQTGVIS